MAWDCWVLDVTSSRDLPCWVPLELNEDGSVKSIVYGMNIVADKPPGRIYGCVHPDGDAAIDAWWADKENATWADAVIAKARGEE